MISSYGFWIAVVIVILIVMVFAANFTLTRKRQTLQSPVSADKTPVISTISTESDSPLGFDSRSRADDSPSSSASQTMIVTNYIEREPELPFPVAFPDYKPPTAREWNAKPSKLEAATQKVVEEMFGVKFHSIFHKDIRNPETNQPLQLDLYNEQLKLAFECNGEQHYHYVPFFHRKGIEDFYAQARRDRYKVDACDRLGIYLITIPYNCPHDRIADYIRYYMPEAVRMRNALNN